jgi:ketol-acid reductoisomerase
LSEQGYPKEAIALELYASAEPADIFLQMARQGILEQMRLHSPTSQYGVLSRRKDATGSSQKLRERMEQALAHIRSGAFAAEWKQEEAAGYPNFQRLRQEGYAHPIQEADRAVRQMLAQVTQAR